MKYVYTFKTILGTGELYYKGDYIVKFEFYFEKSLEIRKSYKSPLWVKRLSNGIIKYMSGKKIDFKEYKLYLEEFTEFEKNVLEKLRDIKYGEVISYKELGEVAGYKNPARAVGNLMKKNPFPIIVPCHRVIKSDGTIGKYSMGIKYKRFLLDMERVGKGD